MADIEKDRDYNFDGTEEEKRRSRDDEGKDDM